MPRKRGVALCHPGRPHYGRGLCRQCVQAEYGKRHPEVKRASARRYAQRHPERVLARRTRYESQNKERLLAKSRAYHQAHKEERNAKRRAKYHANKDREREWNRQWRLRHPLESRARCAKRRALLAGSAEQATATEREWRALLFGNKCAYCSGSYEAIDHVIALDLGGTDGAGNLVPACWGCNASKKNRPWLEWFRHQTFYDKKREKFIEKNTW